jgi:hypothetical protein
LTYAIGPIETEIDFTSHHSFLRVRRDQFRQNCKKTPPTIGGNCGENHHPINKNNVSSRGILILVSLVLGLLVCVGVKGY